LRTQTTQSDDTPVFTSAPLSKFANDLPHFEGLRLALGTFIVQRRL